MSQPFKEVYRMRMPIRWGDLDALGHVNNTVYFRYMEQVRISWFDSLNIVTGPTDAGFGPVIVNAHLTFLKQLRYPGEIECRMLLGKPGRSSIDSRFELRRADDLDTLVSEGGGEDRVGRLSR